MNEATEDKVPVIWPDYLWDSETNWREYLVRTMAQAHSVKWHGTGVAPEFRPFTVRNALRMIGQGQYIHGGLLPEYWEIDQVSAVEFIEDDVRSPFDRMDLSRFSADSPHPPTIVDVPLRLIETVGFG